MRLLLLVLALSLTGCVNTEVSLDAPAPTTTDLRTMCAIDADCVAAECCHPISAVNFQFAPDCSGAACTMDCKPGTIDCGQGYFKCINKRCTTIINAPL